MEVDGGEMRREIKGDGGGFAWKVMVLYTYIIRERKRELEVMKQTKGY